MRKAQIFLTVLMGLAVGLSMGACKKRPKAGAAGGGDLDPLTGLPRDGIYADGLGPRFDLGDGEEVAGMFSSVYFSYDSAQISPEERSKLETVAQHLRANPSSRLVIEGHCDERGSREYNLSLGERRALAARAYLIGLGIDGGRLQTKSYGSERPVAFGHDESAWRMNRRAEFLLAP